MKTDDKTFHLETSINWEKVQISHSRSIKTHTLSCSNWNYSLELLESMKIFVI